MKKIALLKRSFKSGGGLEKQASIILKELLKKGFFVELITTEYRHKIKDKNLSVSILKSIPILSFLKVLSFDIFCKNHLKKKDIPSLSFDRISRQTYIRAGDGVHREYLINRKKSSPLFKKISFLLNPLHMLILKIEKRAFENRELKKIITNSNMVKKDILKHYNVSENMIEVIHNGVEWDHFGKYFLNYKKKSLAKKLKIELSKYIFLFIGNGFERKGLKALLKALSHIDNKNFHLLVVGEDKKLKKFKKESKKLGLENMVSFFGKVSNTIPFYQISDALVIPSIYDPFANVTIEALSMGLFVITSKNNGGSEVINNENGKIVDIYDEKAFANCLKEAMRKKKNKKSAEKIRSSVKNLKLSNQLKKIINSIT